MTEALDLPWLRQIQHLPEVTIDMYKAMPEDVCMSIEVVDGWIVRCESAEPSHQVIQRNFTNHLRAAVKRMDASEDTCHRVDHDLDVLLAEGPKFHFRRPDVTLYRRIEADDYIREDLAIRRMDFHAVNISEPFALKLTWEDLDDGL